MFERGNSLVQPARPYDEAKKPPPGLEGSGYGGVPEQFEGSERPCHGLGGSDDGGVFGVVFFDKDTVEVVDVVEVIE
jgi:hypothetical protein